MSSLFQILLATPLIIICCCQALRLDQVVRPGCTVGVVMHESELTDKHVVVGQFLESGSHAVVTYKSGKETKDDQVSLMWVHLLYVAANHLFLKCYCSKKKVMTILCCSNVGF